MAHMPVLADAAVAALQPRAGGVYVDATFGGGGYTRLLLAAARCRVVAFDRDPDAAARARALAAEVEPGRLAVVEAPFGQMRDGLASLGLASVDGIALDLGMSSFQLDDPARGFSFRSAGPLDMRMSSGQGPSAADLVNTLGEAELARLLRELGDEPAARRIARAIAAERAKAPIATTDALAALVARVKGRRDGRDPATLTFQALRMAVNDELGELARALEAAEAVLRPGGRLAVVSFHSGEDALVKRFVDARGGRPEPAANRHLPAPSAAAALAAPQRWRWLSRKVAVPDQDECRRNPRARSARLRAAARVAADGSSESNEPASSGGGVPWLLAA